MRLISPLKNTVGIVPINFAVVFLWIIEKLTGFPGISLKIVEERNIRRLLSKKTKGIVLLNDEQQELEAWYDAFPQYEEITFISEEEKRAIGSEIKASIFSQLNIAVAAPEPVRKRKFVLPELIWRVAAAILVLIVGGASWILLGQKKEKAETKYISIVAPAGKGTLFLHLPDSSKVWLYPGSTVRYPEHFEKNKREVQLINGVAFFDVKHDKQAAFIVHAPGGVQTQVLGTRFSIRDYKDLPEADITLLEGSVLVRDSSKKLGLLKPNQQIRYNKARGSGDLREINPAGYTSWLQGKTILENAGFDDVAKALNGIYGVAVLYNSKELSFLRFNLQFSNKTPLVEVLELLRRISNINFKINGNQVTVSAENH